MNIEYTTNNNIRIESHFTFGCKNVFSLQNKNRVNI